MKITTKYISNRPVTFVTQAFCRPLLSAILLRKLIIIIIIIIIIVVVVIIIIFIQSL